MKQVDYLAIGHACYDLIEGEDRVGGATVFSGRTAKALGCDTAVLTSTAADYDMERALPGIDVHRTLARETTTFENVYTEHGRVQILHARAKRLTTADIPAEWRRSSIVHMAPVADEVEPDMIHAFSNSLVGLTPQGWLRRWNGDGHVYAHEWPDAARILPLAAAVLLSDEDLPDRAALEQYKRWSFLLVLTQGAAGCTVFFGDEERRFPAPPVEQIEPTGAGDIFAASFLIRLHQTAGNPWEAARFANEIAAQSVTKTGMTAKIALLKEYRSRDR
jgi:sugar/nucleoside kinase (ribokinase family)